jgi:hypothetical protein
MNEDGSMARLPQLMEIAKKFKLKIDNKDLSKLAIEWSVTRGSRSGRVAWQFIQDLASKKRIKIS